MYCRLNEPDINVHYYTENRNISTTKNGKINTLLDK